MLTIERPAYSEEAVTTMARQDLDLQIRKMRITMREALENWGMAVMYGTLSMETASERYDRLWVKLDALRGLRSRLGNPPRQASLPGAAIVKGSRVRQ